VSASTRGCFAQGRSRVYGSVENALHLEYAWQGILLFQTRAWSDRSVQQAAAAYSACMAGHGFRVNFPQDAVRLAQERFGSRPVMSAASRAEITQALADARCQRDTQLVDIYETTLVQRAAGWINARRAELVRLAALQQESLLRAYRIVTGGPPRPIALLRDDR